MSRRISARVRCFLQTRGAPCACSPSPTTSSWTGTSHGCKMAASAGRNSIGMTKKWPSTVTSVVVARVATSARIEPSEVISGGRVDGRPSRGFPIGHQRRVLADRRQPLTHGTRITAASQEMPRSSLQTSDASPPPPAAARPQSSRFARGSHDWRRQRARG